MDKTLATEVKYKFNYTSRSAVTNDNSSGYHSTINHQAKHRRSQDFCWAGAGLHSIAA